MTPAASSHGQFRTLPHTGHVACGFSHLGHQDCRLQVSPDQPRIKQLATSSSPKQHRRPGPVPQPSSRPDPGPLRMPPGTASSGKAILEVRNTSEVEDGARHVWLPPRPLDSVPSERGMVMGPDPIRCVIAVGGSPTGLPGPILMPSCCPTESALENRQDNGKRDGMAEFSLEAVSASAEPLTVECPVTMPGQ